MTKEVTIPITAHLTVDEDAGQRALKILEWYCNDNGKNIGITNYQDGTIGLYFKKVHVEDETLVIE